MVTPLLKSDIVAKVEELLREVRVDYYGQTKVVDSAVRAVREVVFGLHEVDVPVEGTVAAFVGCEHSWPNCVSKQHGFCPRLHHQAYGQLVPQHDSVEVTTFVNGLFEMRNDLGAFKNQLRDFLIQSKEFSAQDNKDLYAKEAAMQREAERPQMLTIPGLIAPSELQDEMVDT